MLCAIVPDNTVRVPRLAENAQQLNECGYTVPGMH